MIFEKQFDYRKPESVKHLTRTELNARLNKYMADRGVIESEIITMLKEVSDRGYEIKVSQSPEQGFCILKERK